MTARVREYTAVATMAGYPLESLPWALLMGYTLL